MLAAACGNNEPPGNADAAPAADAIPQGQRYLPLATGATWTYKITDTATGQTGSKTSTVGGLEDVGGMHAGVMAYRVTTEKLDGSTVSWQSDTGNSIVRYKEQTYGVAATDAGTGTLTEEQVYDPYKLRLDESPDHLSLGASYVQSYTEYTTGNPTPTPKSETWTVEAVDESVTVPAGTFTCLKVHRTGGAGQSDKIYYYARGVGKVKEEGGQLEELMSYSLP